MISIPANTPDLHRSLPFLTLSPAVLLIISPVNLWILQWFNSNRCFTVSVICLHCGMCFMVSDNSSWSFRMRRLTMSHLMYFHDSNFSDFFLLWPCMFILLLFILLWAMNLRLIESHLLCNLVFILLICSVGLYGGGDVEGGDFNWYPRKFLSFSQPNIRCCLSTCWCFLSLQL